MNFTLSITLDYQLKYYHTALIGIPFIFSVQAEDINDCLYLTFQFSLDDADITMLDKDGNEKV